MWCGVQALDLTAFSVSAVLMTGAAGLDARSWC
jgi:hypothetical protein